MEYTEVITDALTGEVIVREFTKSEIAELEKIQAEQNAQIAAEAAKAEAKATARKAILDRLGLTADEAAILLG
jgi:uncharacterized membrane protein YqiK